MANVLKISGSLLLIGLIAGLLFLSGCDLLTKTTGSPNGAGSAYGKDLVINEVFTISPSKYYAYSWIEFMNPTNRRIKWFDQTFPAYGTFVGSGGAVGQTGDDGVNWVDTFANASYGRLNSVIYPNTDTGFACGNNGALFKLNNHGLVSLHANLPAKFQNLNFYSITGLYRYVDVPSIDHQNKTAYVVGDSGVMLRTTDRGNSWGQIPVGGIAGLHARLNNIYSDFLNVYVVGDAGTFLQSTNAGTKWSAKIIPEPYRTTDFYSCWFLDTLGWATGNNGVILASTNGGSLWVAETSHVNVALRSCFFGPAGNLFNGYLGWVVGDNGTILRTVDDGATWKKVSSGTTARLNSVVFVDSLRGWAFGAGGVVVASTDGGQTWLPQSSGTSNDIYGSDFLPLLVTIQNGYYLSMYAQRNYVFYDPATFTLNTDFITKTDTGIVLFQPQQTNINVDPRGFVVVTNDSLKFADHTKLGPGATVQINFSFAVDTVGVGQQGYNPLAHLLKWNLLPSSEIRLIKFFYKTVGATPIGYTVKTIDVVRWGGYRPRPDDYPGNTPVGFIPENWSLARYNNDPGEDPSVESTVKSFYLCNQPIPGWFSQQGK
ncbi:MAG TPA: YCF48-related protein [Bacteroidota bacterium]|nr:YCF48-related protein [Bacteroidota bacterium]